MPARSAATLAVPGAVPAAALAVVVLAGCAELSGPSGPPVLFTTVEVGGEHSCAVSTDGDAYCWGRGLNGELGDGGFRSAGEPVRVDGEHEWVSLALGFHHSCGLVEGGEAFCWGWNADGQLGLSAGAPGVGRPSPVDGGIAFTTLTAGWYHTCGLDADGIAYCWGQDPSGEPGDGGDADSRTPRPVAGGLRFSSIEAGGVHTCAIAEDGAVYCWGGNGFGQLGDGGQMPSAAPSRVSDGRMYVEIAAGFTHTCGITREGRMFCWGSNNHGELGIGGITRPGGPGMPEPVAVRRDEAWVAIRAGFHYTCAVDRDGTGYCWGAAESGQLGIGLTEDRSKPFRIADPPFSDIAVGEGTHSCGVTPSNGVYCWGFGRHGQLGRGDTAFSVAPRRIHDISQDG